MTGPFSFVVFLVSIALVVPSVSIVRRRESARIMIDQVWPRRVIFIGVVSVLFLVTSERDGDIHATPHLPMKTRVDLVSSKHLIVRI